MYRIKIMNEYLHSPIWIYDDEDWIIDSLEVIDKDNEIRDLSEKIENLFSSYYHFNVHDEPAWFDEKQEKEDKDKMIKLIEKLKCRLEKINDGTFEVEDLETKRLREL